MSKPRYRIYFAANGVAIVNLTDLYRLLDSCIENPPFPRPCLLSRGQLLFYLKYNYIQYGYEIRNVHL